MRIADVVAALDDRPTAVVIGNEEAHDLAARVAEQLGLRLGSSREGDGSLAVLVVAEDQDLASAVATAAGRVDGLQTGDHCLVLVEARGADLPVTAIAASAAGHGLELAEVIDVAHPTLSVALRLVAAGEGEVAAARTELRLEQEVSRRARVAVAATARELERRGERIEALRAEVTELRERVETLEVQHERAAANRDRELVALQREVGQLEASTSYRIGHTLVRMLKDPRLLLRVPVRILRWLRS